MTHGNLHRSNVMVSRDERDGGIKAEAILDIKMSGWYPAYWELVKALNTIYAAQKILEWYDVLPADAIRVWGAEYAIDRMIDRFFSGGERLREKKRW